MLGSYHNAETFSYQDEVGHLVLHVCQVTTLITLFDREYRESVMCPPKKKL